MDIFVKNIYDKLRKMGDKLVNNLMKGFMMFFDLENKILFVMVLSIVFVFGGVVIMGVLCELLVVVGVVVLVIVFIGLVDFGFVCDFKIVCENVVNVRIKSFIKIKIK